MAMRSCTKCGKAARKRVAVTMFRKGVLKGALVCQECAKDGIVLLAAEAAVREVRTVDKGPEAAVKAMKRLRKQFALASCIDEEARDVLNGKLEGVDACIALVESGRY